MKYIYLIGSIETSLYKIGVTSKKELKNRLSNIQVGCPYKVEVIDIFPSEYSYKVEKILHRTMSTNKTDGNGVPLHGEWFYLGLEEVYKFQERCKLNEDNYILFKDSGFG